MWPGEYGCKKDVECSQRCARGYCEANTDKAENVGGQCRCRNSYLLFGKCCQFFLKGVYTFLISLTVLSCPVYTTSNDKGECVLKNENDFWNNK
jgi:hypothetical protein